MVKLLATSVVRGSQQGDSHGGAFLVDLDARNVRQVLDWNAPDIEWRGRGWDRGLRGIAFADDATLIAASDELFAFDPDFQRLESWRNPYLKHAHEMARWESLVLLTSTGYDSLLGFDLEKKAFVWGLMLVAEGDSISARPFDPQSDAGPAPSNMLHINSVHVDQRGIFFSGLRTPGLLLYDGEALELIATLPSGAHNAQPYQHGILLNDTNANFVRFVSPSFQRTFDVPRYHETRLTHVDLDDSRIARQAFGRGLCVVKDGLIAAGSSPATIALHDLDANKTIAQITLSMDVRTAIHGLALWPWT